VRLFFLHYSAEKKTKRLATHTQREKKQQKKRKKTKQNKKKGVKKRKKNRRKKMKKITEKLETKNILEMNDWFVERTSEIIESVTNKVEKKIEELIESGIIDKIHKGIIRMEINSILYHTHMDILELQYRAVEDAIKLLDR